jgi:hypothetical protein
MLAMQLGSMTTHVDDRGVSWNLGLSLPLFAIPFGDIAGVKIMRTDSWGGAVTLGTDDAPGLYAAINSHLSFSKLSL